MRGDLVQPDRPRVVDQEAQEPVPGGQVTDLRDLYGVHPVVDEGAQPSISAHVEHTQGGVLGVHQAAGHGHDAREHPVEGQVCPHRHDGVEQQPEPFLLVERAVDPVEHLTQEVVEVHVAQFRGPA